VRENKMVTIEKQQSLKRSLVKLLDSYPLTDKEYKEILDMQEKVLESNLAKKEVKDAK